MNTPEFINEEGLIQETSVNCMAICDRLLQCAYKCYNHEIKRLTLNVIYNATYNWYNSINVITSVMPSLDDVVIYSEAFIGNPQSPGEKQRIVAISNWLHHAEEFISLVCKCITTILIQSETPTRELRRKKVYVDEKLKLIREYRVFVDNALTRYATMQRESISMHSWIQARDEILILSQINAVPETVADIICSYLPNDLLFKIRFTKIDELQIQKSLSKIHVIYLRHIQKHIFARYAVLQIDNLFSFAMIYGFISRDLPNFFFPNTGVLPKDKKCCIKNILSLIQYYEYTYNIYHYKSLPNSPQIGKEMRFTSMFRKDSKTISDECIYIYKLIRFVGNIGKPKQKTPLLDASLTTNNTQKTAMLVPHSDILTESGDTDLDIDMQNITPIPFERQSNTPRYLTYKNGILVDQTGQPTSPELHNTTHEQIIETIRKYRELCRILPDDETITELLEKYVNK
jgi:hypothetical protein